ncbi:MAG TPA: NADH-quinone oxidoreductase subunit NuoE [Chloroflexi bacterium]|nr:NADH-quinone oxidoreductase subunit NuoE [Chloroflexota bacterium]
MDEELVKVDQVIDQYQADQEALVEILREINAASGQYLTRAQLERVARRLRLPLSKVYSVASFYSLISLKPLGRHVIRFCEDAPCHVVGGKEVWDALERELGIPFGETTPDGQWSLLTTSCIGACAVGPVMMVDTDIYGNLTPEKVHDIIERYREADRAETAAASQGGEA